MANTTRLFQMISVLTYKGTESTEWSGVYIAGLWVEGRWGRFTVGRESKDSLTFPNR